MLIDRPPLTESWHLLVMLALGVVVVAIIHRAVKRRVATLARQQSRAGSRDWDHPPAHD